MDVKAIVQEIDAELNTLMLARTVLAKIGRFNSVSAGKKRGRPKGSGKPAQTKESRTWISPAGKKRLSVLMKERWAERKAAGLPGRPGQKVAKRSHHKKKEPASTEPASTEPAPASGQN